MSAAAFLSPTRARFGWRGWAGIFLVGCVVSFLLLGLFRGWQRRSANYLLNLEEQVEREERSEQAALVARLGALDQRGRANLVEAAVSTPLLGRLFQELDGVSFRFQRKSNDDEGIEVRLGKPRTEFRDGFPRLDVGGQASHRGISVELTSRVVVRTKLEPGKVILRLVCLGLAPESGSLPDWAAEIAKAEATAAANDALDKCPIVLPLQTKVEVPFTKPGRIELPVKTPNGQVFIGIDLPQPPTLTRWVQPREAFFGRDALHVLLEPLTKAPPPESPLPLVAKPNVSPMVTAEELERRLAPWRLAPDLSYSVRLGRAFLIGLLSEVNTWQPEQRTVKMRGLRQEGHLLDRTGGLPFGNGFKSWLDGPDRLQGQIELRNFKPGWEPSKQQIPLTLEAAAQGDGQVHVHGNAPHIDPPKIFGVRIGGGATIGGGAGTSVGIRLRQESVPTLSAVAQLTPATGHFEVRLVEPGDVIFKVEAGGIPDALLELFRVGLRAPLPRDRPLFEFDVPKLLAGRVEIPLPGQNAQKRSFFLRSEEARAGMDADGLSITGKVTVGAVTPP